MNSGLCIKFRRIDPFGMTGLMIYYFLSLPTIRYLLFGENTKILDAFDGNAIYYGNVIAYLGQLILIIPFYLNKYVFSYFDVGNLNLLVLLIFSPLVYRYFSFSRNLFDFFILSFLFFPAPLLFLSTFNKETLMVLCLFLSYGYSRNLEVKSLPLYFFIYTVVLRPYLAWIPFVLRNGSFKKMLFFASILLTFLFTNEFSRNLIFHLFNRRLQIKSLTANTEVTQTIFVDSIPKIFLMILEVLPQFIFPFFYQTSLKTLILQLYVFAFLYCCFYFRNKYSNVLLLVLFIYVILDPDLGAFFRHLSSYFLLFPLMLGLSLRGCKKIQTIKIRIL